MANRLSRSGQQQTLQKIHDNYSDVVNALRFYYSNASSIPMKFAGYSNQEVDQELYERIEEIDQTFSLSILTCVEAAFKLDFDGRVQDKKKDPLSRSFRSLHKRLGNRISLNRHIFAAWQSDGNLSNSFIQSLSGAFEYRHWLAHGRYWNPKLRQIYDYQTIYLLADSLFNAVPSLINP
jgi:hypothetical protein